MRLTPIFTEKSTNLAKQGKYTFAVDVKVAKSQIKSAILKIFGVHVTNIRTVKIQGESKKNSRGRKVWIPAKKKAIVMIKDGEKLDIFEEKKK